MDEQLLQRTRYVLRSRVRKVQTCPSAIFVSTCQHFLRWIQNHPLFFGSIRHLHEIPGEFKDRILKTLNEIPDAVQSNAGYDPGFYSAKSFEEHASTCLSIIEAISDLEHQIDNKDESFIKEAEEFLICNFGEYLTGNSRINYDEALEVIRDVVIDGLYEYLDEQLDTRNVLYAVLLKYKQRSEWFNRSRLRFLSKEGLENKIGERALAVDLQEYVLDQGVEFVIEPVSSSGEADLILRDSEGRYIIIDAKHISVEASRSKILDTLASGFNQVARYCNDYNEPMGFLIPFINTATKIRIDLEEEDGFRFLMVGGKTIYYLPVIIAELPSASAEGKAKEVSFTKTPFLKLIYSSINDLFSAFIGKERKFHRPVMILINKENNVWKIGFVTQDVPIQVDNQELMTVYCPFSYGFSGELYLVPASSVKPLVIPPTEAMKFIVSGGVSGGGGFHPKIRK